MDSKIDRCAKSRKTATLKDKRPNIIRLIILVFIPLSLFLCPSCKQNEWADWKLQNKLWLENNKHQEGVRTTSTGLQFKIIEDPGKENNEPVPNTTSTIVCDYSVKLINGCYIQKDVKGASINLANAIPGFAEGCHKIHNHGDIELFIPAYLGYDYTYYESGKYGKAKGYGTEGTSIYIPPYSTLIYTIHICSVSGN